MQPSLDWELRAHKQTPYDSVQELMNDFGVGTFRSDRKNVEIVAFNVAAIGGESSLTGGTATIAIRLGLGLPISKARVGYRVIQDGRTILRKTHPSAKMEWRDEGPVQVGTFTLAVIKKAIVQCFAVYDNIAQHSWILSDPSERQNSRRLVYELIDPELSVLSDFLGGQAKQPQFDFELGCAWLLWMIGFGVFSAGLQKRTSDAPDLIALAKNHPICAWFL